MDTMELRPPRGDEIPNHPELPVVIHRGVDEITDAEAAEALLAEHDWNPVWRDGVFDFHHFHSNAHEALAVVAGSATLTLGGPQGEDVDVEAGHVLVLPAGTGHRRVRASEDFLVVGAYPPGQEDYDVRRGDPDERDEVERNIRDVALPPGDPVTGREGPLAVVWRFAGG